jgi:hypothetical protein
MRSTRTIIFMAPMIVSFGFVQADAQPVQGKFRGAYVCEKLPTTRDILRTPLDLIIEGGNAWFARPLFNLDGTRVVGSEMASGAIDGNGQLHLTSQWSYLGDDAKGEYSGTFTASGGTLTGTQTWTRPGVASSVKRTCTAALVPAPNHS